MVWKAVAQEVLNLRQEGCAGHSGEEFPLKHSDDLGKTGIKWQEGTESSAAGTWGWEMWLCFFFLLVGISWIPFNFLFSALFGVYPDDLECFTSEHELLLSTLSNACGAVAPQQREITWNCTVMSTLLSWGHSAFQNNPNYTNLPLF